MTKKILALGWKKEPRTEFDVLPLVIHIDGGSPKYFELPSECMSFFSSLLSNTDIPYIFVDVQEVPIVHPNIPGLANLKLKWHGIPVISNMKFDLGGIIYTAAPFNGWYECECERESESAVF